MDTFIFDMDGTIFDTEKLYYETWLTIGKKWGFEFSLEDKNNLSGRQIEESMAYMMEKFSMDRQKAIAIRKDLNDLRDKKIKELTYHLKKDGLVDILTYLRENHKKIGLASSSIRHRIDFLLEREGVKSFFDTIVSSEDIAKGKPDPEIFKLCMEKLDSSKDETYIIEDSLSGIKSAKASGAVAILILDLDKSDEIKKEADLVFGSLGEFLTYLKKEDEKIDTRDKTFKIVCPSCKKSFEKILPTALFREDKSYEILKNMDIGKIICPSCWNEFRLNYRYVYTDNNKKLMLINDPKFQKKINQLAFKSSLKIVDKVKKDKSKNFTIRMCTTSEELVEKIRIFEDGKIDHIVEIMKEVIRKSPNFKFKESIRGFYYKNENKFTIKTDDGIYEMNFIDEVYEDILNRYINLIDIKEASKIDRLWAEDFIKSL